MIGLVLSCLAIAAILFGTVVHFWILARLENAGVRVKYFANIADNVRAYTTYRNLARDQGWPLWPSYAVYAGFLGVLLAGLSLFFDSPFIGLARWLN